MRADWLLHGVSALCMASQQQAASQPALRAATLSETGARLTLAVHGDVASQGWTQSGERGLVFQPLAVHSVCWYCL